MAETVTKISYANHVTLITLASLPCSSKAVADVLTAFAEGGINVDMISQTAPQGGTIRLSFSVSDEDLSRALSILGGLREKCRELTPEILPGNCKIAFYDAQMVNTPGVAAKIFAMLSLAEIQVMLVTTSDVDISILVSDHDLSDVLHLLSGTFGVVPEEVTF